MPRVSAPSELALNATDPLKSNKTPGPGPRTRNIIENQLFRRQRSLKLEALQRQRTLDSNDGVEGLGADTEPFDKVSYFAFHEVLRMVYLRQIFIYRQQQTHIVIIFTEKAKLRHCQDVEKIIQEFGIQTTLEIVG